LALTNVAGALTDELEGMTPLAVGVNRIPEEPLELLLGTAEEMLLETFR
jgi:hypothetical protein